jgi:DNA-binding response OmpR family regulator
MKPMAGNREKILIVEDDPTLLRVLKDNFEFCGYTVTTASDGKTGWEAVRRVAPDLIILDLMLPQINGYDLCRRIRHESMTMPIIMLTAKAQEADVVLGLDLGADDYVTKPFSVDVLLARVNARLRRQHDDAETATEFGDCRLEWASRKLFRRGREIPLTPKEFGLLAFFARNKGRALSRDQILDAVWGQDLIVAPRSVDRCVNTLRQKIEDDAEHPRWIATVRPLGYRFEA